jgi:hypothetical protein
MCPLTAHAGHGGAHPGDASGRASPSPPALTLLVTPTQGASPRSARPGRSSFRARSRCAARRRPICSERSEAQQRRRSQHGGAGGRRSANGELPLNRRWIQRAARWASQQARARPAAGDSSAACFRTGAERGAIRAARIDLGPPDVLLLIAALPQDRRTSSQLGPRNSRAPGRPGAGRSAFLKLRQRFQGAKASA